MDSEIYIVLHPETAHILGIQYLNKIYLKFGIPQLEVMIILNSNLNTLEMILSEKVINLISIPISLEYEVIFNKDTLLIGPFIGILHSYTEGKLIEQREKSQHFIEQYKYIKGAIISFAFDNIDIVNKKVKGFLYEPNEQKWIPGIYPYPASVFKIAVIDKKSLLFLQNEFDNRFFNSQLFNKWEMYKWLIEDSEVSSYLPQTILYTEPKDIFNFLEENPYLYIKPLYGSKGRGIIKIIKSEDCISVIYKQDSKINKFDFIDVDKAYVFFENILESNNYIIQKMLHIVFDDNNVVDFRMILMKDQLGDWRDLGLYGRVGSSENIVSNRSSGGKVKKDIYVFKQVYKFSQDEALFNRREMSNIAIKAAKSLDKLGLNMGRYGIDMALDEDKNIWIIEMNHKDPNDWIALYAGDKNLIYKIRLHNMLYAKYLAGFPKDRKPINIKILSENSNE